MHSFARKTLALVLALILALGTVSNAAFALQLETGKSEPVKNSEDYAKEKQARIDEQKGQAPVLYGTAPGYLSTSYIQCYIHENGGFNIGTSDGDCLLFSYPGGNTSETLVRIDSVDYFFDNHVTDITFSDDGKSCVVTALIDEVEITQTLSIIKNPNSSTENVVAIRYMVSNNASVGKNVGLRIMMDTMLGDNDGAPFIVNGASVTTEKEFSGNSIPQFYQALDSLSDPSLTATGYFYYSNAEKPDKVQFASWPGIQNSEWDYRVNSARDLTGDSAVAAYFYEETLPVGTCRSYVTYYGAYDSEPAGAYDEFPYTNDRYIQELAEICAGYSALAYQDYQYDAANDVYYNIENNAKTDTAANNRSKVLNDALTADNFTGIESAHYNDPTEDSATYTLAHKTVNHNGTARDLIVVVIRGTNVDEWKGNMNVTGSSYVSQAEHDSFQNGATQIQSHLMRYMNTYTDIENPMVLITGHSRGGAIGNLLAVDLMNDRVERIDETSIFAYLFAVPNATTAYDTSLSNIYNFCFSDDFVPNLPLNTNWGYGKHGTTFVASADAESTSGTFYTKQKLSKSLTDGKGVSFDEAETSAVIKHVAKNWSTVSKYYNQTAGLGGAPGVQTLYQFMHDIVAPAAMGDTASKVLLKTYSIGTFGKIANFFADGTKMRQSIFDTHNMFTYYNALVTGVFPVSAPASLTADASAPTVNADIDISNAALEQEALTTFASTDTNLDLLGWDITDTATWTGITWDENGRVSAIDLCYKGLNGNLDLSAFDRLTTVDVSGNNITSLLLPTADTSVLSWLDCGYNKLTALDIIGQPLDVLICNHNYLDSDAMAEAAGSVTFASYEEQNPSEDIPYSSLDCDILTEKVLTNTDIWDTEADPDTWVGVEWTFEDGEYRVSDLDLSDTGLSGDLDLTGLTCLQTLDVSGNALTSLKASDCDALTYLNCNSNKLTSVTLSESASLSLFSCSDNYLTGKAVTGLNAATTNFGHQHVSGDISSFCAEECTVLAPVAETLGVDPNAPGEWIFVSWEQVDEVYHATTLDLAYLPGLSGTLDLSGFEHLTDVDLASTGFESVILPDSMTEIDAYSFFCCTSLTNAVFPAELTSIGRNAFYLCTSLEDIYLPSTLNSIGGSAFQLAANLDSAYFTGNAPECAGNAFMFTSIGFTVYHLPDSTGWDAEVWSNYIVDVVDLLSIKDYPERLTYSLGEELDLTGLTLLQLGTDGSHHEITEGYTVTCDPLDTVGTKTVTVSYGGIDLTFEVTVYPPSLHDCIFYLEDYTYAFPYTGSPITPTVYVQAPNGDLLTENTDYVVSYYNNIEPGFAEVYVEGINNYQDAVSFGFDIYLQKTITVSDWTELESDHNYTSNSEITWIYNAENSDTACLMVTFSADVRFEHGCDYLYIYDGNDNLIGSYTGTDLASRSIIVPGSTIKLVLTTDNSVTEWGFQVSDLQELSGDEVTISDVVRVYGNNRIATAMDIADQLKISLGVTWFDNIVVASGMNFPDALTGSYLATTMDAPILLTYDEVQDQVVEYISKNLAAGGTVYILGGHSAVSESFEEELIARGIYSERLAGSDRFGTNLEILMEAGVSSHEEILICTAMGFADSLSASAAGLPILLVHDSLKPEQKEFLATSSGNFIIIGGNTAVSAELEQELRKFGTVERLGGSSRYETSVLVAQRFADAPEDVVLAYAMNYPDGLCGGPLAYSMGAPLLLTDDRGFAAADAYVDGISSGYVIGGYGLISEDAVRNIFELPANALITTR